MRNDRIKEPGAALQQQNDHSTNWLIIEQHSDWDAFLSGVSSCDVFHTWDFHMHSIQEGDRAMLLVYAFPGGAVGLPVLIREIPGTGLFDATSVYGYAGPVFQGSLSQFNPEQFHKELSVLLKQMRVISLFARLHPLMPFQRQILASGGSFRLEGPVVNIDLRKPSEIQRKGYSKRLQTYIRAAEKVLYIREAQGPKEADLFLDIYLDTMRRLGAAPFYYFDREYFRRLLNGKGYACRILLARTKEQDKVVGGALFLVTGTVVQYYLSGTTAEGLCLNSSKLVIDRMREMASLMGCTDFILGGGVGADPRHQLFQFKSGFSKDQIPFYTYRWVIDEEAYLLLCQRSHADPGTGYFPCYRDQSG